MKKIKVKAIFGSWQGYQEMVNFPPKDVEYLGVGRGTKRAEYYQSKKIKEKIGAFLQKLKIPRMIFVGPGDYDLIHSSRGIIPLNNKPWIIDMEHVHSFFGLNPNLIKSKFWKRFIEKKLASNNCKAILCHCDATRQAFFHFLDCSKFKDKIKVLYPASHIIPLKKDKHRKIRILAVISLFYHKGGPQILEAFSRLEKKYKNIELWIKADTPKEFKKKYGSKNIRWFPYFSQVLPRERLLQKFHAQCDIFLYPTFYDSFGYSLIDAMVAKMPIISTNLFAIPEIVKNDENGFIVKLPGYNLKEKFLQVYDYRKIGKKENDNIISQIISSFEKLIKSKKLRDKMSNESFMLVSGGKFSIKERNNKLSEIYGGIK